MYKKSRFFASLRMTNLGSLQRYGDAIARAHRGEPARIAIDRAEHVATGHQARLLAFGYGGPAPGEGERAAFGPEADRSRRHDLFGAGLERCLHGHLEINRLAPGLGFGLQRQRGDEGARRGRVLQGRARRAVWPGNADARIAHRAGSQCSMINCRFCIPLNSLTARRYAARTEEGRGSSELKRIAQVQTRNRAAGAADLAGTGGSKGEGRAVMAILDSPGEDADHALVPGRVVEADAGALAHRELRHQLIGLRLHVGFDRAPRAVELVELPRDL